jgi:hypothetical protein
MEWNLIDTAPFGRDLELALIDSEGAHSLSFPCRRIEGGWIEAETKKRLYIRPSHWRDWSPRIPLTLPTIGDRLARD